MDTEPNGDHRVDLYDCMVFICDYCCTATTTDSPNIQWTGMKIIVTPAKSTLYYSKYISVGNSGMLYRLRCVKHSYFPFECVCRSKFLLAELLNELELKSEKLLTQTNKTLGKHYGCVCVCFRVVIDTIAFTRQSMDCNCST